MNVAMASGCVFCEIVARTTRASILAESPEALAFLTVGPIRDGHTLVVPKRHAVELVDATPSEIASVFNLGAEVVRRQRQVLGSKGETLFLASGVAGEQSVFHLHLHVVPRHQDDGLDLTSWWEPRIRKPSRDVLDAMARRLRGG